MMGSRPVPRPMVTFLNNPSLGSLPPWAAGLFDGTGVRLMVVAAVAAGGLVLALRAGWVLRGGVGAGGEGGASGPSPSLRSGLGGSWGRALQRLRGDGGVATVEFVLVFPVALLTVLVLLQTTLMMAGNVFVHYAAFVAARAAIVQAPTGKVGGGGELTQGGDDERWEKVERSAAFALAPVSGKVGAGAEGERLASGLKAMYGDLGAEVPGWVDSLAGQRLNYALEHTDAKLYYTRVRRGGVRLVEVGNGGTIYYSPKAPVTVGVAHRLHLSIPYASVLFSDGTHATAGGDTHYARLFATSTLTLEGYDRNLPEEPPVERDP